MLMTSRSKESPALSARWSRVNTNGVSSPLVVWPRFVGFYRSSSIFNFTLTFLADIWWVLLFPARHSARRLGGQFGTTYAVSAGILSFVWLLYALPCWRFDYLIEWIISGPRMLGTRGRRQRHHSNERDGLCQSKMYPYYAA